LEKHLHIIDFTVPYPADYGGVIDLFWKLPALQEQGVKIHLHCFEYGRGVQAELNKYCTSVEYYDRLKGFTGIGFKLPYIVQSRKNEALFTRLLQDDYPILMEGVHTTYLLNDPRFAHRKKYVRLHNVEYAYYKHLQQTATSLFKRLYYGWESMLLKQYERSIANKADGFWSVTVKDAIAYEKTFECPNISYLPLYLPEHWKVNGEEGNGTFCLYQGDLSVGTNEQAALWLLNEVFPSLNIPLIIAGKNPSKQLLQATQGRNHVHVIANPAEKEMNDLIAKAHINILPSFSNTGIKLKLLHALYNGRHCLVNNNTVEGSGVEDLCIIATGAKNFREHIQDLYNKPFSAELLAARQHKLHNMFNNASNAMQQVKTIWESGK